MTEKTLDFTPEICYESDIGEIQFIHAVIRHYQRLFPLQPKEKAIAERVIEKTWQIIEEYQD